MKDCKFKLPLIATGETVFDSCGLWVAECDSSDFTIEQDCAHAAHIAKCVNLHEESVKALEESPMKRLDETDSQFVERYRQWYITFRFDVLTKAKEPSCK